jgi:hypothetical protein
MRLTLVLASLASGCSFIAMRPPSPPAGSERVRCNDSRALPVIDTVAASVRAGAAICGVVADATSPRRGACAEPGNMCWNGIGYALGVVAGIPALIYGASAAYGYVTAGNCGAAEAELNPPLPAP